MARALAAGRLWRVMSVSFHAHTNFLATQAFVFEKEKKESALSFNLWAILHTKNKVGTGASAAGRLFFVISARSDLLRSGMALYIGGRIRRVLAWPAPGGLLAAGIDQKVAWVMF